MKKIRIIAAMTLLTFTFAACDKVEDLLEFDLDFSLDETFSVVTTSPDDVTYSDTRTINVNDDGNISENLDNIKSYEVEKVTITVTNLVTNGTPSISDMAFALTHSTGNITIESTQTLSLSALQASGATDLGVSPDLLNKIKEMFVAGGDITLGAVATVENGPASFDITISIEGKITIAP